MRVDFEQSHEFNFKCPECGSLLNLEDNRQKIKDLEAELVKIEKELKQIKK
ncbi:hypothetical protein HY489_03925 [Candidatus Woesearchaeota archaeon]|nr:hypothetical protein [Candidatus Woesearchaeota archaeon]